MAKGIAMIDTYEISVRTLDILFSVMAIFLLFPILLPVIILLRFTGEGEVFYLQERVGRNGNIFKVIKFATMLKNSPNLGHGAITVIADPRVLPVGKILRKTKINELPQLINILKGDMSFVGPRPLMLKQFEFYGAREKQIISEMRPGLTGAGSIIFRDEEKYFDGMIDPDEVYRKIIAPGKALIECWYYNNRSIGLYFKLIILTAVAVLNSSIHLDHFLDDKTSAELRNVLSKS